MMFIARCHNRALLLALLLITHLSVGIVVEYAWTLDFIARYLRESPRVFLSSALSTLLPLVAKFVRNKTGTHIGLV